MLVNIAHFQEFGLLPARTIGRTRSGWLKKEGRLLKPPFLVRLQFAWRIRSTFDDVDDLVSVRAKDDVPAVHEDEIISTPFRIDFDDM
ncbi:MAG: hypothetical protein JWP51_179 [Bradyrhizobium sp.]|nr:hypothetical protein [Bradyrhizobium sp.]